MKARVLESGAVPVRVDRVGRLLDRNAKYILLLPALIALIALFAYPVIYNLDLSVHNVDLFNIRRGDAPFVGLQEYARVLTSLAVWQSLYRTVFFGATSIIIQLVLGMALALVFNRSFAGKNLLMTICLIPMMITPIAVGMFWRLLLNMQWGIINYLISLVGIDKIPWLGDTTVVQFSVIGVTVWLQVSFVFLVFLGGLSSLPVELYETADVDGATGWQKFRFITLPLMIPVILVVIIVRIIDAFRAFDVIYALTNGGPGDSSRVVSLELYEVAWRQYHYSDAAALALIMSVIMLALTFILMRMIGRGTLS